MYGGITFDTTKCTKFTIGSIVKSSSNITAHYIRLTYGTTVIHTFKISSEAQTVDVSQYDSVALYIYAGASVQNEYYECNNISWY